MSKINTILLSSNVKQTAFSVWYKSILPKGKKEVKKKESSKREKKIDLFYFCIILLYYLLELICILAKDKKNSHLRNNITRTANSHNTMYVHMISKCCSFILSFVFSETRRLFRISDFLSFFAYWARVITIGATQSE